MERLVWEDFPPSPAYYEMYLGNHSFRLIPSPGTSLAPTSESTGGRTRGSGLRGRPPRHVSSSRGNITFKKKLGEKRMTTKFEHRQIDGPKVPF